MTRLVFPIADVIARLDAAAAIGFVGQAMDMDTAMKTTPPKPTAVYVMADTRGGDELHSGSPIQQARTTWLKLVLWSMHSGQPAAAAAQMDALKQAVHHRLIGWAPSDDYTELLFQAERDELSHGAWSRVQMLYRSDWETDAVRQP